MCLRQNELEDSCYQPLAILENKECYRHINGELLIIVKNTEQNSSPAPIDTFIQTIINLKRRNASSYICLYL